MSALRHTRHSGLKTRPHYSKLWVKVSADDPGQRLRESLFHTPLELGPRVWDFGTDCWTYGSLRNEDGSVVLTNVVAAPGATGWRVETGPKGQGSTRRRVQPACGPGLGTRTGLNGGRHLRGGPLRWRTKNLLSNRARRRRMSVVPRDPSLTDHPAPLNNLLALRRHPHVNRCGHELSFDVESVGS